MHLRLLYKKVLCVFLSLLILISSTQTAYAMTSTGGWTLTDSIIAGANTTINATKTAGANALKSTVTVGASAAKVGQKLIKGGGSVALAYAVVGLIGEGIDWVMTAGGDIKYTTPPTAGNGRYLYYLNGGGVSYLTMQAVCDIIKKTPPRPTATCQLFGDNINLIGTDGYNFGVGGYRVLDNTQIPGQDKIIPLSTVAQKIISNAESGHAPSQELVKAVALEGFAAGEYDAALDAAATDADASNPPDTDNPPTTDNPPITTPFDPSSILSALASLGALLSSILAAIGSLTTVLTNFVDWWKTQWATFTTAITDFFTWVRADAPALEDEPITVDDGGSGIGAWQDTANAGYVRFNGQCPADVQIPMSYMGASTNLSISYVPFCHFATLISPAVILGAWIAALMIISGGRTRE